MILVRFQWRRWRSPKFNSRLEPPGDTPHVVAVGVAEASLEICLLARDDVAHDDCQRQRKDEDPWAARSYTDAGIEETHADVDRIATPAVYAGCDQRADGLVGGHWRSSAREIANSCSHDRDAGQDQASTHGPTDE